MQISFSVLQIIMIIMSDTHCKSNTLFKITCYQ